MHGIGSRKLMYEEVVDQTIRNLTSGGLGIPLVVIQLGVNGSKKTRSCTS